MTVYREKWESKGVEVLSGEAIQASPFLRGLEDEWGNMLRHQLPALPPFSAFSGKLPHLYEWLEGTRPTGRLTPIPAMEELDDPWSPPSTVSVRGARAPVEEMRFAAANHLRVELGYQDSNHLIEPYSLRKTRSGQLTLYAVESETGEIHSYALDQIHSIRVSEASFTPGLPSMSRVRDRG